MIWPGATSKAFAGFPQGRNLRFLPEDADLLEAQRPGARLASAEMRRWGNTVTYGRMTLTKPVVGVRARPTASCATRSRRPAAGSSTTATRSSSGASSSSATTSRTSCSADKDADRRDDLGQPGAVHGHRRHAEEDPDGHLRRARRRTTPSIPLSTFQAIFGRRYLSEPRGAGRPSPEVNEAVKKRLYEVLGAQVPLRPRPTSGRSPCGTRSRSQKITANIGIGIEIFLGIIGALTLLIGGIGVANIMYAVVKHRTKEIGVQMALGARRSYVIGPLVRRVAVADRDGRGDRHLGRRRPRPAAGLRAVEGEQRRARVPGRADLLARVAFTTVSLLGIDRLSRRVLPFPPRGHHPARGRVALRVR